MKKLVMIAAMMLMSIGAFAEEGTKSVGINAGYANYGDGYKPFGLGIKFQYEFIDDWRAEVAYNYWFPKDKAGVMDFNLDIQYLFSLTENLNFYPMAGFTLGMTHGQTIKEAFGGQESIPGFNVGCGVEYMLTPELKINADVKYESCSKTKSITYDDGFGKISAFDWKLKYDGPVIQVGISYIF